MGGEGGQKVRRSDDSGVSESSQGKDVATVPCHKEVGLSFQSTFQDPVILLVGRDDRYFFRGIDQCSARYNPVFKKQQIFPRKKELGSSYSFELVKDERAHEQVKNPYNGQIQEPPDRSFGKGEDGDIDVRVKDNPIGHKVGPLAGGLRSCLVNDPFNV